MTATIRVHKTNYSRFFEKLAELNAKFNKKHLPQISYEKVSDEDADGVTTFNVYSDFNQTNISGKEVQFEGVVSLVEQDENRKIYSFSNEAIPTLIQNCQCDECHKKMSRSKYIVFSKVGRKITSRDDLIVLGSKCAKNYFPFDIDNYFGLLSVDLDELTNSFDESYGCYSYVNNTIDMEILYYAVCDVSDNLKFYEKDGVTKEMALTAMYDKNWKPLQPSISYEEIRTWLENTYANPTDTFGWNIHSTIFVEDKLRTRVPTKFVGLAVYSFFGAKRQYDKMQEQQKAKAEKADSYYGNIGDKFQTELTFDSMFTYETDYGFSHIILFHDNENHVFKWTASNGTYKGKDGEYYDYEIGQKYTVKGTIKAHNEYKGTKQTVVTRCKVVA